MLRSADQEPPGVASTNLLLGSALHGVAEWDYTLEQPEPGWEKEGFSPVGWRKGLAGFGTVHGRGPAPKTAWKTDGIWLRRQMTLASRELKIKKLKLEISYNDEVEVYFNGVLAFEGKEALIDYWWFDVRPEAARALRQGVNLVAVHCRKQRGDQFIDLGVVRAD